MKTLLIGNAIVDVVLNVQTLPKTGDDIYCQKQTINIGGCAYNVATILSHFGLEHDLVVPIGEGSYASMIKQELLNHHYKLHIEERGQDNGYCLCLVEDHGERTFITVPGIEADYRQEWLSTLQGKDYDHIYISGYEMEGKSGKIISEWLQTQQIQSLYFAPGPRITFIEKEIMDALLSLHPILHLNETEALKFSGQSELLSAAKIIYERTQNELFITLGENGVLYYNGDAHFIPSVKTPVINTIGAGDSHLGGLIAMRSLGYDTLKSCEIANRIAAKVVSLESSKFEKEYFNKGDFIDVNTRDENEKLL